MDRETFESLIVLLGYKPFDLSRIRIDTGGVDSYLGEFPASDKKALIKLPNGRVEITARNSLYGSVTLLRPTYRGDYEGAAQWLVEWHA